MKLRVTITVDIPVLSLDAFEATTLEEAAINQLRWLLDGDMGVADLFLEDDSEIEVTPIYEP